MVRKNRGIYGILSTSWVLINMAPRNSITGVHSNQDHIWLVKIGDYIGFYVDRRS